MRDDSVLKLSKEQRATFVAWSEKRSDGHALDFIERNYTISCVKRGITPTIDSPPAEKSYRAHASINLQEARARERTWIVWLREE